MCVCVFCAALGHAGFIFGLKRPKAVKNDPEFASMLGFDSAIQVKRSDYTKDQLEMALEALDTDESGSVSWEEFRTMFQRVRADKSGWEPKKLFNLVEFMMHDKDASGTIDREECMEILFRRFGRDLLEEKVDEFMQNDEDGDNTITFTEFLHMDQRNDTQKSKKGHFKYSRGLVETTLEEDRRLLAQVNAMLAAKDEKAAMKSAHATEKKDLETGLKAPRGGCRGAGRSERSRRSLRAAGSYPCSTARAASRRQRTVAWT